LDIKGLHDALVITIHEGQWEKVYPDLLESFQDREAFFKGARIALQVGDRNLKAAELGKLRDALAGMEIQLSAVISTHPSTQDAAADLGLARTLPNGMVNETLEMESLDTQVQGDEAVFIQRTLRSGNNVRYAGHVIVLGDVNPGAEIVAGGNVIVWGRLRGMVHAGAAGDERACVCALELAPTQLRIARHVAVSPKRPGKPRPERAFIRSNELIAEEWRRTRSRK